MRIRQLGGDVEPQLKVSFGMLVYFLWFRSGF